MSYLLKITRDAKKKEKIEEYKKKIMKTINGSPNIATYWHGDSKEEFEEEIEEILENLLKKIKNIDCRLLG